LCLWQDTLESETCHGPRARARGMVEKKKKEKKKGKKKEE
jgi:hypothetical protein